MRLFFHWQCFNPLMKCSKEAKIILEFSYRRIVWEPIFPLHYSDDILRAMASKITAVLVVCSTVCSVSDQI